MMCGDRGLAGGDGDWLVDLRQSLWPIGTAMCWLGSTLKGNYVQMHGRNLLILPAMSRELVPFELHPTHTDFRSFDLLSRICSLGSAVSSLPTSRGWLPKSLIAVLLFRSGAGLGKLVQGECEFCRGKC